MVALSTNTYCIRILDCPLFLIPVRVIDVMVCIHGDGILTKYESGDVGVMFVRAKGFFLYTMNITISEDMLYY